MKQLCIAITASLAIGVILGLFIGNSFVKQKELELQEKDMQIAALQQELEGARQEIEGLKADSARVNQQLSNIRAVLDKPPSAPQGTDEKAVP
ncbi:MAG: LapA family protein [Treponema sp.]|jgi:peptidoglycan hydrolase CwlO-like protein|nr:LapA family protein [Treponema sp.]